MNKSSKVKSVKQRRVENKLAKLLGICFILCLLAVSSWLAVSVYQSTLNSNSTKPDESPTFRISGFPSRVVTNYDSISLESGLLHSDYPAAFTNESGSRPYGDAGGVSHFLYGKLPTMNAGRLTEPSSEEATYLRQDCGSMTSKVSHASNFTVGRYVNASRGFPWSVRILASVNGTDYVVVCGGVVVGTRWIVTARHCYKNELAYTIYVHYGGRKGGKLYRHRRLYAYPEYNDIYNLNDFLLVELKEALPARAEPICLPNPDVIPSSGRKCVLAGWPGGPLGDSPFKLLWVEVEKPTSCQSRYCGLLYDVNMNVCDVQQPSESYPETQSQHCHGLSGSPLMCIEHGRWVAYAVLDWSAPKCDLAKGHGFALTSTRIRWMCCHTREPEIAACAQIRCD